MLFTVISKKSLTNPMSQSFPSMLSSKCFTSYVYAFDPLKLIFVCLGKVKIQCFISASEYKVCPIPFLEKTVSRNHFPHWMVLALIKKHLTRDTSLRQWNRILSSPPFTCAWKSQLFTEQLQMRTTWRQAEKIFQY